MEIFKCPDCGVDFSPCNCCPQTELSALKEELKAKDGHYQTLLAGYVENNEILQREIADLVEAVKGLCGVNPGSIRPCIDHQEETGQMCPVCVVIAAHRQESEIPEENKRMGCNHPGPICKA